MDGTSAQPPTAAIVGLVAFLVAVVLQWRAVRLLGWRPTRPGEARLVALLAVVGVSVASVAWFTSSSGFYTDDLINFRQAQVEGMSLRYLLEPTSAHFAPGHRLGDWIVQAWFPLNFPFALALMLAGLAVSLLLFHRLVSELCRPGPGPLVVTLLYGMAATHVAVVQWWASGLDRIPATIASLVAVIAYVRFFRAGSRRMLWLSWASLAVALLFYVKPVLVPVYLVLARVLLLEPDRPARDTVAAAFREWRVWLGYAVITGGYLALYVGQYRAGGQIYQPSLTKLAGYAGHLWFEVLAPSFFGVYVYPDYDRASLLTVLGIALPQVAVIVGLVWSIRRRPRVAGRAWAFFALGAVANTVVIGLTRIGFFDARETAYILFYNLETVLLFFLAAAVALLPGRVLRRPVRPLPRFAERAPARALVAVGVAAYLAFSLQGARRVRDFFPGGDARRYMEQVAPVLDEVAAAEPEAAFVDRKVPNRVVFRFAGLYTGYSEILPLLYEDIAFDTAGRDLLDLDRDVTVRPVAFVPEVGGDARTLIADFRLGASHATIEPSPDRFCVRTGPRVAVIGYQPAEPLTRRTSFLRLGYSTDGRSLVGAIAEPVDDGPKPTDKFVTLLAGPGHEAVLEIDAPTLRRLYLVVAARSRVCVERLELGRLEPRPGPVYVGGGDQRA